jgi:hypothetical protein
MSVLLSWHEKVRSSMSCLVHQPFECHLGMILPLLARTTSMTVQAQLLTTAIACGGSRSRKHRQGHDGSPHSMSRSNVLSPYVLCADHSRCRTRTTPSTRQAARALCPTANMLLLVINYSRHTNNLHHAQPQPAFSPVLRCDLLTTQFIYPESILRHDNPVATRILIKLQELFRRAGNLVHAIFQKEKH